jgi:hypothetical protein
MTNQQLIPTEELLNQWCYASTGDWREIAAIAARWGYKQGADEELEACCEWIPKNTPWDAEQLRAARRPKPPSLKEQALERLELAKKYVDVEPIRRALEQLPDAHYSP